MSRYICPVCRANRDVQLSDHISWKTHARIGISILFISTLAYLFRGPALAIKLAFLYLPVWAISEFFHWSYVRNLSKCPHCHFDPILYQRDWREARKIVETRLTKIKQAVDAKQAEQIANFLGRPSKPSEPKQPATPSTQQASP